MPIDVTCENCFTVVRVRDSAAGKRFRCKECGSPVTVPAGDDDDIGDMAAEIAPAPRRRKASTTAKPQSRAPRSGRSDSKLWAWAETFHGRFEDDSTWKLAGWTVLAVVSTIALPFVTILAFNRIGNAKECQSWPQAEATITKSEVEGYHRRRRAGVVYRPEVEYRFKVGEQEYTSDRIAYAGYSDLEKEEAEAIARRYPLRSVQTIHYKPDDPAESVIETEFSAMTYMIFLIPLICLGGPPLLVCNGLALWYRLKTR